jgi:formate hydrogenlyase transcriptional activator
MSAVEFGLALPTSLVEIPTRVPFVEHCNAAEELESLEENDCLADEPTSEAGFEPIVGRCAGMRRVLRQVEVVAPTDSGVLIQGETGTGKELIAQAIHNRSARRDRAVYQGELRRHTLWPAGE